MALTAHMVTIDGVDPYGPGPWRDSALGYVQVVDLGGYLMLHPVYGDGLTVSLAASAARPAVPRLSRTALDLSWTVPPGACVAETMGT